MKATVHNFRGIKHADIDLSALALIIGKNGTGKTSIARSVGAALTGNPLPFPGMKKANASQLVADGIDAAAVTVHTEAGKVSIAWPRAEVSGQGKAPHASAIATGLLRFQDIAEKDRAALFNKLLNVEPTEEDLKFELGAAGLDDSEVFGVCSCIRKMGWNAAYATYKEDGTKTKGAWEMVTRDRYGSEKAKTWCPTTVTINDSLQALREAAATAQKAVELALQDQAVSSHDKEALQAEAGTLDQLNADYSVLLEQTAVAITTHDKAEKQMKSIAIPDAAGNTVTCPHCGCDSQLSATSGDSYLLLKAEPVPEEISKKHRLDHAAACGNYEKAKLSLADLRRAGEECNRKILKAEEAARRLEAIGDAPVSNVDINALRVGVTEAEQRVRDYERYQEALKLSNRISGLVKVVGILADDGLRLKKLSTALANFNDVNIRPLCHEFKIPAVTLDKSMQAFLGDRPYSLLSGSEQFRVNTVMQVAIAQLDGSEAVIIDEADILDKRGRGGLLSMLNGTGLPALICMTMNDIALAPNLAAMGCGTTYWIAGGVAGPVSAPEAAA